MPERIVGRDGLSGTRIDTLPADILVVDIACWITGRRASRQRGIHDSAVAPHGIGNGRQLGAGCCDRVGELSTSAAYTHARVQHPEPLESHHPQLVPDHRRPPQPRTPTRTAGPARRVTR